MTHPRPYARGVCGRTPTRPNGDFGSRGRCGRSNGYLRRFTRARGRKPRPSVRYYLITVGYFRCGYCANPHRRHAWRPSLGRERRRTPVRPSARP